MRKCHPAKKKLLLVCYVMVNWQSSMTVQVFSDAVVKLTLTNGAGMKYHMKFWLKFFFKEKSNKYICFRPAPVRFCKLLRSSLIIVIHLWSLWQFIKRKKLFQHTFFCVVIIKIKSSLNTSLSKVKVLEVMRRLTLKVFKKLC